MSVAHDQPQIMAAVKAWLRDPLMQAYIGSQLALHRRAAERRPAPVPVSYAFAAADDDPPPLTEGQLERALTYLKQNHAELQQYSADEGWRRAESYARGR